VKKLATVFVIWFIHILFYSQDELKAKAKITETKVEPADEVTGIPDFWLTVFKNVDMLSEMIQVRFFKLHSTLSD